MDEFPHVRRDEALQEGGVAERHIGALHLYLIRLPYHCSSIVPQTCESVLPRYAAHQAAVLQYPLDDHLRTTVGLADELRVAGVVAEQYARRKLVQKVGHLKIFRRQRLPRLLDEYRQR
uniref:Uncharacterized protein n=1 Tax=Anopheles coluzzii TaxID=1518534 RepID=A0A8W7PQY9_ANOCL